MPPEDKKARRLLGWQKAKEGLREAANRGALESLLREITPGFAVAGAASMVMPTVRVGTQVADLLRGEGRRRALLDFLDDSIDAKQRMQQQAALSQMMYSNEARLQQQSPRLYAELLSGKRLAPGDVVIGGRPRRDFVDEVTYAMSTGTLDQNPAITGEPTTLVDLIARSGV